MNTIKTLALATIIIGMASCASIQKSQMEGTFGKSTKLTTEEDSLFKAVVLSHSNLQLKPHKVSRQVVAGTNYRYECVDNNKKRLRLSPMSHFQDRTMPAYWALAERNIRNRRLTRQVLSLMIPNDICLAGLLASFFCLFISIKIKGYWKSRLYVWLIIVSYG